MQWKSVLSLFVLVIFTIAVTNAESTTQLIENPKSQYNFSRYLRNVYDWLKDDIKQDLINFSQGRTFGAIAIRRLQFTFIPLFYKLGVIGTMVGFLTMITLKGLAIGVLLLILNLSSFLANIQTAKYVPTHYHSRPNPAHLTKTVHLHIHNNGGHHEVVSSDAGFGGSYSPGYGSHSGSYSHSPGEFYGKIDRTDDWSQDQDNWNDNDSSYAQNIADELNDKGYLGNFIEKLSVG